MAQLKERIVLNEKNSDKLGEIKKIPLLCVLLRSEWKQELWGSELSLVELLNSLSGHGINPLLVDNVPAVTRFRKASFQTFEVSSTLAFPFGILWKAVQAIRVCRARSVKAVFLATNYWFEGTIVALIASATCRKPLLVGIPDTFKESEDTLPISSLFYKAGAFRLDAATLMRISRSIARRIAVRRAATCLVPARAVAEYLVTKLHARRCAIIGRGLDPLWFEEAAMAKTNDVIYVGRLSATKGWRCLILAWKEVIAVVPHAKLLIVGSGPALHRTETFVRELGLRNSVTFTGYLSDPTEIRQRLLTSKVFVLTSRNEGFARAVAEALACGLACIVTDLPTLRELYHDAVYFAPPDDHKALSRNIVSLLTDDTRRKELSARGKVFARRFSWSAVAGTTAWEIRRAVGTVKSPSQN